MWCADTDRKVNCGRKSPNVRFLHIKKYEYLLILSIYFFSLHCEQPLSDPLSKHSEVFPTFLKASKTQSGSRVYFISAERLAVVIVPPGFPLMGRKQSIFVLTAFCVHALCDVNRTITARTSDTIVSYNSQLAPITRTRLHLLH